MAKAIEMPFCTKEIDKRRTRRLFRQGMGSQTCRYQQRVCKQHEFKERKGLEAAAMVSSSHTKLLPKTVQGSDDDNEAKETEEIKG